MLLSGGSAPSCDTDVSASRSVTSCLTGCSWRLVCRKGLTSAHWCMSSWLTHCDRAVWPTSLSTMLQRLACLDHDFMSQPSLHVTDTSIAHCLLTYISTMWPREWRISCLSTVTLNWIMTMSFMSLLLKIGACHLSDIDDIDDFDWVFGKGFLLFAQVLFLSKKL